MATRASSPAEFSVASLDARLAGLLRRYPVALPWTVFSIVGAAGYAFVFAITAGAMNVEVLRTTAINSVTAWAMGLAFAPLLAQFVQPRGVLVQAVANVALAFLFSIAWYMAVIIALGWNWGSLVDGALIRPFRGPAFIWQYFQGVTLYGVIAALSYLDFFRRRAAAQTVAAQVPAKREAGRVLVRAGDEIVSLDIDDIVLISGADDYSEVETGIRKHLVRKRLAEFEAELPDRFVRIHRSSIVNLDRIVRAEPAGGGRLTLHLERGLTAMASRAGARVLRERTV